MPDSPKGKLTLTSVPTPAARKKVREYLSSRMKNASPERIDTLLDKTPVVLGSKVPADKGRKLAAHLITLGATAVFEEHGITKEATPGTSPEKEEKQNRVEEKKKIWSIKDAFFIGGFILACAGIWLLKPFHETEPKRPRVAQRKATQLPTRVTHPSPQSEKKQPYKRYNFSEPKSIAAASPSVTSVPPQDMLEAYHYLFRFRPDMRFLQAYDILIKRHNQLIGGKGYTFQIGEIKSDGKHVFLPLTENDRLVQEIILTLPLRFTEVKHSLAAVLDLINKSNTPQQASTVLAAQNIPETKYRFTQALTSINTVDPRYIAAALSIFEDLWREGYNKAELLKASARAYATLLLTTEDHLSHYDDHFAGEALAFLVLAEHFDKSANTRSEELLIAMSMGYTDHADATVRLTDKEAAYPEDNIISSYMRHDIQDLEKQVQEDEGMLGRYLLTRHYREAGLFKKAQQSALQLLEDFPTLYPSIIESIKSGPLNTSKILTIIYPQNLVKTIEHANHIGLLKKFQPWQQQANTYTGNDTEACIPLSRFEKLLEQWTPYAEPDHYNFIIDSKRVKDIYRMQYANALYSRYNVLFHRWGVIEQAKEFVDCLMQEPDEQNNSPLPLIQLMHGEVYAQLGEHKKANHSLQAVIQSPQSTGKIIQEALFSINNPLTGFKLIPAAADRIDGRPFNRLLMGYILQQGSKNLDLAAKYYESGLAQSPYHFSMYRYLASTRGSDQPFQQALQRSQHSYQFLQQAAKYYTEQGDLNSLERAASLYSMALDLAPSESSLVQDFAQVLTKLEKFEQAISALNTWLAQYSGNELDTVTTKSQLAAVYLQSGQPKKALETLGKEEQSYQAGVILNIGKAYTLLGQITEAEKYYLKAVERYPTVKAVITDAAEFYWKQEKYEQAAELIAHGRSLYGVGNTQWYLASFFKSFQHAENNKITGSIEWLQKKGAIAYEIKEIGQRLADEGNYELAFSLISNLTGQGRMEQLEFIASAYQILLEWQGKEKASAYFNEKISEKQRGPILTVLYNLGFYTAIENEIGNPDSYPEYQDFVWLQLLIARLFTDTPLSDKISAHYAKKSADHYNALGQYLLGELSQKDLLNRIQNDKQRCEFAYYIGLKKRLEGDFASASHWYHICQLTFLPRNGEFHWATNELFWWAMSGLENRHRLVSEDISAYRKREFRKIHPEPLPPDQRNKVKV